VRDERGSQMVPQSPISAQATVIQAITARNTTRQIKNKTAEFALELKDTQLNLKNILYDDFSNMIRKYGFIGFVNEK
jgi:hypothetical protein